MLTRKINKLKSFYSLYTSGLNRNEVESLLKKDTVDAIAYLQGKSGGKPGIEGRSSLRTFLKTWKEIFISFVMRLTPARRLVYGIAFITFFLGLIHQNGLYLLGSFGLINFLLVLELVDKLTTRDELEIAREIQVSLQPEHIPDFQLLSFATFSKPARVVGGDFFDIIQSDSDKVISILGDVADKGISAALYAAYVQSMFQSLSLKNASPTDIFSSLNHLISKRLRSGDFVTAVIALFDLTEKSVTISRAGHNWPLFYCYKTREIQELRPKGLSIGTVEDRIFDEQLEAKKIYLSSGDLLLLYSDGVTEAANADDHMFDISRLKSAVFESVGQSSKNVIDHINHELNDFVRSGELQDDATMLAVKIK